MAIGPWWEALHLRGDVMIFRLLIGLVVLSPFPLASAPPWASGLMACAVAVPLIAWGVTVAFGRSARRSRLATPGPF